MPPFVLVYSLQPRSLWCPEEEGVKTGVGSIEAPPQTPNQTEAQSGIFWLILGLYLKFWKCSKQNKNQNKIRCSGPEPFLGVTLTVCKNKFGVGAEFQENKTKKKYRVSRQKLENFWCIIYPSDNAVWKNCFYILLEWGLMKIFHKRH